MGCRRLLSSPSGVAALLQLLLIAVGWRSQWGCLGGEAAGHRIHFTATDVLPMHRVRCSGRDSGLSV